MTRNDITTLFPDATKEQIDALLNIHSADIGRAKAGGDKLQADLDAANRSLEEAKDTIAKLEAAQGDRDALQAEVDKYKAAEQKRQEEAQKAAEAQELERRFNAVSGERKYIHDMVRAGVMRDFGEAIRDKANTGKGDREIFDALVDGKGYFASQNPNVPIQPPMGDVAPLAPKTRDEFLNMTFADQMRYKSENEAAYRQLVGLPPLNGASGNA